MNAVQVPLAHGERIVRREREATGIAQPLDPGDAADRAEVSRARRVDGEREGRDLRDTATRMSFDPLRDEVRRGALLEPDGVAGGARLCGNRQRDEEDREREPFHAGPTRSVGLTPGTKPWPGASRAR